MLYVSDVLQWQSLQLVILSRLFYPHRPSRVQSSPGPRPTSGPPAGQPRAATAQPTSGSNSGSTTTTGDDKKESGAAPTTATPTPSVTGGAAAGGQAPIQLSDLQNILSNLNSELNMTVEYGWLIDLKIRKIWLLFAAIFWKYSCLFSKFSKAFSENKTMKRKRRWWVKKKKDNNSNSDFT